MDFVTLANDTVPPLLATLCREIGNIELDIEDLQTFVEVADAGGVSHAARQLGVTKSIVSRRLARLEEALGVQLLARNTRGAALAEAGVSFRDHAARACAEIDAYSDLLSMALISVTSFPVRRFCIRVLHHFQLHQGAPEQSNHPRAVIILCLPRSATLRRLADRNRDASLVEIQFCPWCGHRLAESELTKAQAVS